MDLSIQDYISEESNNRIQCLDSKGIFKYVIKNGSSSIAVDSKGHIYIKAQSKGIVEYGTDSKYVATLGIAGNEDGCLIAPNNIFISSDNFLYISDELKPTIQKFSMDGKFVGLFLKTTDLNGAPYRIYDICEDESEHIVLLTQMQDMPLVFVNNDGYYHMKYNSQTKQQFLEGKSLGIKKDDQNAYSENYFVSSYKTGYVKKINSNGHEILQFTSIDTTNSNLLVSDFILDKEGNVIVGFIGNSIQKFDKEGGFVNYIVKYDASVSMNRGFQSIAVDTLGNVYTLDNDCEVLVFNSTGKLTSKIKLDGKMLSCPNTSEKIVVTQNGEFIYVTDKMNYRVQIFKRRN